LRYHFPPYFIGGGLFDRTEPLQALQSITTMHG
jgi:hypothetical protein